MEFGFQNGFSFSQITFRSNYYLSKDLLKVFGQYELGHDKVLNSVLLPF